MMTIPELSVVRLLTDRFRERGVVSGSLGVVVLVHGDGACEVEFSRPDGTTIDWFAVRPDEIALVSLPADMTTQQAVG